jgi:tetratricopeptide (TPR) repeat protein
VQATVAQKSEKMAKQELRAPDAFQRIGYEAQDWLIKKQSLIGGAVVLVLVAGLGIGLYSHFSQRGEEKAAKALGQALQVLERPVEGSERAQGSQEKPFPSQEAKDKEVRDSLNKFRTEHGGSRAAATAALPLGKAEYRLGNYDAALTAFKDYLDKAPKEDPLRASAYEGQGYTYEAQGKYDQALGAFEEMAKAESGEYLQGMGQYHRARMLVQLGRKDEAAQELVNLKTVQANTAAGRLATERLAVLAAQGVKVPEPTPAATEAAAKKDAG